MNLEIHIGRDINIKYIILSRNEKILKKIE